MYRIYQNNIYIKRPTGWHCIGLNHTTDKQAAVTIGSWSKQPIDRELEAKLLRDGKPCEPPWRGRSTL